MIEKIKKLIILNILVMPNISRAEEAGGGLVKCGVSRDCTICDLFILVRDVMNYLFQLLGVVAVISIIIGGFYLLISGGDQGKYKQGVDIIKNAIIGVVLTLAAFIFFNFILVGLGFQASNIGFGGGGAESDALQFEQEGEDFRLFRIKCDSASYFNARDTSLGGGGSGGGRPNNNGGGNTNTEAGQCGTKRCGDAFGDKIKAAANAEGIDPKLLQALLDTENANGTNCATNKIRNESNGSRSCGLFQLNTRGVAANCGITCEQALDVDRNIACAAKELKRVSITNICGGAHLWNPGACSSSCQDLRFTYCTRAKTAYDFYNQCTPASAPSTPVTTTPNN